MTVDRSPSMACGTGSRNFARSSPITTVLPLRTTSRALGTCGAGASTVRSGISSKRANAYEPSGWHCATAWSPREVHRFAAPHFNLVDFRGVLFAPLHRLPDPLKKLWSPVDGALGKHLVGRWLCAHRVYLLERRSS